METAAIAMNHEDILVNKEVVPENVEDPSPMAMLTS